MSMVSRPLGWQLSDAQWAVLTGSLRLADFPSLLQMRAPARGGAEASVELAQRGLLRAGLVEPDLAAALRLLHRPLCWVDSVWLPDAAAERPVRVVAARDATTGVCALRHPDRPGMTLLEVISATGLAAAVVGKLPPHPPGRSPGATMSLEPDAGRHAAPGDGLLVAAPAARTSRERDSAAIAAVLDKPHARAGQIAANARDPSGRVRRSEVLRWCDNPDGRYQVTISRQPHCLTVGPCDPQRLGDGVQRLLASVQPR
jgi:EspG family